MSENNLDFIDSYNSKVEDLGVDWDVYGILDGEKKVYSLTNDAKIVGRVFELLSAPAIREVASDNDLEITPAESQTIYPDFTLEKTVDYENDKDGLQSNDKILSLSGTDVSEQGRETIKEIIDSTDKKELSCKVERNGKQQAIQVKPEEFQKIAVDVKTTYRKFYSRKYTYPNGDTYEEGDPRPYTFTLGGFASFLRNYTKNIQYDYRSYTAHYVIGFIYTRNPGSEEGIVKSFDEREDIQPPYQDVEFFVQQKYKIAGTSPGSGNTENIGSFRTNDIDDLRNGNGPFAEHGKEIYKEYWRNYPTYRGNEDTFSNLEEYFEWKEGK